MAEIKAKVETSNRKYRTATWENGVSGDTFAAVGLGQFPQQTVQIIGTVDGAQTGLEGSNDGGTTWFDITSDGSTAISGIGGFYIWESPQIIRPKEASGGASGTDLTYIIGAPAIL